MEGLLLRATEREKRPPVAVEVREAGVWLGVGHQGSWAGRGQAKEQPRSGPGVARPLGRTRPILQWCLASVTVAHFCGDVRLDVRSSAGRA